MKTIIKKIGLKTLCMILVLQTVNGFSQSQPSKELESIAVLNINTKDSELKPSQVGSLTRIELGKLGVYNVMDDYEVYSVLEKKKLNSTDCFGKECLINLGKNLDVKKMLAGSIDVLGKTMIITLRIIDVNTGQIEYEKVKEFLNLPDEIQAMIRLTLREMFKMDNDPILETSLTKKNAFENATNNPKTSILKLNGPRMGLIFYTGETSRILRRAKQDGGFDAYPVMFQFGYQFEKQYLNEGNFQALFEFVPMITGLDQGMFIPSCSILNGLRNNKNGFEFAFGPTVSLSRIASVYLDPNTNKWNLADDWKPENGPNPYSNTITNKSDSRGTPTFTSGFVFAIGKSFKSGNLNIPVNAYIIPSNSGMRIGISMGFNATKTKD